jgi:dynactin 4
VSLALTPSLTTLSRQSSITEDPRPVDKRISVQVELPDSSFNIHHRDDSAEFDEDIQNQREDPK